MYAKINTETCPKKEKTQSSSPVNGNPCKSRLQPSAVTYYNIILCLVRNFTIIITYRALTSTQQPFVSPTVLATPLK